MSSAATDGSRSVCAAGHALGASMDAEAQAVAGPVGLKSSVRMNQSEVAHRHEPERGSELRALATIRA